MLIKLYALYAEMVFCFMMVYVYQRIKYQEESNKNKYYLSIAKFMILPHIFVYDACMDITYRIIYVTRFLLFVKAITFRMVNV